MSKNAYPHVYLVHQLFDVQELISTCVSCTSIAYYLLLQYLQKASEFQHVTSGVKCAKAATLFSAPVASSFRCIRAACKESTSASVLRKESASSWLMKKYSPVSRLNQHGRLKLLRNFEINLQFDAKTKAILVTYLPHKG